MEEVEAEVMTKQADYEASILIKELPVLDRWKREWIPLNAMVYIEKDTGRFCIEMRAGGWMCIDVKDRHVIQGDLAPYCD